MILNIEIVQLLIHKNSKLEFFAQHSTSNVVINVKFKSLFERIRCVNIKIHAKTQCGSGQTESQNHANSFSQPK